MRLLATLILIFSLGGAFTGCSSMMPAPVGPEQPPARAASALRASAVVTMKKNGLAVAGRASIFAMAPASFRIEAFGPFGQTMMMLASDGTTLFVASGGKTERFAWGSPGIPYPFGPSETVSFLTGGPRPVEAPVVPGVTETRDELGRLTGLVKAAEGAKTFKVALSDYRDVQGAHIPFLIEIEEADRTIAIRYKEAEVDIPLDEGLFSLGGGARTDPKEVD